MGRGFQVKRSGRIAKQKPPPRLAGRVELALSAARETLEGLGRLDVQVLVASQDEIGPNLEV